MTAVDLKNFLLRTRLPLYIFLSSLPSKQRNFLLWTRLYLHICAALVFSLVASVFLLSKSLSTTYRVMSSWTILFNCLRTLKKVMNCPKFKPLEVRQNPLEKMSNFAMLTSITSNGARKAITQFNNLRLISKLERKSLRNPRKYFIVTFAGPFTRNISNRKMKKKIHVKVNLNINVCLCSVYTKRTFKIVLNQKASLYDTNN